MKRTLRIARTEVLEQLRQPWMIFILALTYTVWLTGFGALFFGLDAALTTPEVAQPLLRQLADNGASLDAFLKMLTSLFGTMGFTTLPTVVGIVSGLAVLHERSCGTLPFLMLAPLTRWQLLLGKLLGALAIPFVLHLTFVGAGGLLFVHLPSLAEHSHRLGGHPAWWVANLLGAPAAALLMGSLGAVISSLSRDARTSMQYANFVVALFGLGIGLLLEAAATNVALQLVYAAGSAGLAALAVLIGAQLISTDAAV